MSGKGAKICIKYGSSPSRTGYWIVLFSARKQGFFDVINSSVARPPKPKVAGSTPAGGIFYARRMMGLGLVCRLRVDGGFKVIAIDEPV